jgi:hypothetical protein
MLNDAVSNSGYMYVCIYVCMYVCIYTYIYILSILYIYIYTVYIISKDWMLLIDELERMWTKNAAEFSQRSHKNINQDTPYLDRLEAGTYRTRISSTTACAGFSCTSLYNC